MGIRVTSAMRVPGSHPMHLTKDQRLASIRPDHCVRKSKDGKCLIAYLCEDRVRSACYLTQKLTTLAQYLSDNSGSDLAQDRISASSLYKAQFIKDGAGKTGAWAKFRYRCRAVPLEEAIPAFEQLRAHYDSAVVLGSERSVQFQERMQSP